MESSRRVEKSEGSDSYFMRLAIDKAISGIKKGQTPFAACIAKGGKTITCVHNMVWANTDITAHAEILAIREACTKLETIDLSGCTLYSTCEPCPMCFTACHWARISNIVYGARIEDAQRIGFRELSISNSKMKQMSHSHTRLVGDFMRKENLAVFEFWSNQPNRKTY